MTNINAYIHFNGQCREAMEFYKKCFGGELHLQKVKESPMAGTSPAAMQNQIIHSSLTKGAVTIMGTDMNGPAGYKPGNNISLTLNCSSEKEINTFFSALSAGGNVIHPVHESFWGALFAVCTDQYGIEWMLNYEKSDKK